MNRGRGLLAALLVLLLVLGAFKIGLFEDYEGYAASEGRFDGNISDPHPTLFGEMSEEKRKNFCHEVATSDLRAIEVLNRGLVSEKVTCEFYYLLGKASIWVTGDVNREPSFVPVKLGPEWSA